MKIINDSRRKTYFVQRKTAAINTYIAGPTNGAHRATRLTIQSGKTRLDLIILYHACFYDLLLR
jgi:hypothetical protein